MFERAELCLNTDVYGIQLERVVQQTFFYVYFHENTQKIDASQVAKDELCLYDDNFYIYISNK